MNKTIYWLPRIISLVLTLFISLFAFDVFDQPRWFLALLIHLIPSFILLLMTLIAWKYEKIGGWLFLLLCLVAIWTVLPNQATSLIFVIPLLAIGLLFLVNGFTKNKK